MIIRPRIRGFICINAHPVGCASHVQRQAALTEKLGALTGPRNVLVVGGSAGYGLACRIVSGFGCQANTIGVSFEKAPTAARTASAGWYNNLAFDRIAQSRGLFAHSINADAFADETKHHATEVIKAHLGTIDLLVYSLAAPIRTHPRTGVLHRSAILPIGQPHSSRTLALDFRRRSATLQDIHVQPATDEEISNTVAVMGGEDWQMWVDCLHQAGVLASGFKTIAFNYLGNDLTYPIYRGGTIGRAKLDLDRSVSELNSMLRPCGAMAQVAVLKAVVTQASTAIPIVPLYFSILFDVMKAAGNHEGAIEHMNRMFRTRLYSDSAAQVDPEGRIRMDDWEELPEIQTEVARRWGIIDQGSLHELADIEGFISDFMNLFGFEMPGVDYDQDVDPFGEDIHP